MPRVRHPLICGRRTSPDQDVAVSRPPPTVEKMNRSSGHRDAAVLFQSTASDQRTTSAQRHLEFTRASRGEPSSTAVQSEKLTSVRGETQTLKGKKN